MDIKPIIGRDRIVVVSTAGPARPVIRRLKNWGFKPKRIDPDQVINIPDKAKIVISVPGAMSHGAQDCCRAWKHRGKANGGDPRWIILSQPANLLPEMLKAGAVCKNVCGSKDPSTPNRTDFGNTIEWVMALLRCMPSITVNEYIKLCKQQSVRPEKGTYWKALNRLEAKKKAATAAETAVDDAEESFKDDLISVVQEELQYIMLWLAQNGIDYAYVHANGDLRLSNRPRDSEKKKPG